MTSKHEIMDVQVGDLLRKVQEMKGAGQRLVQICCTKLPDHLEVHYSFDKEFYFSSYRLSLPDNSVKVPSISNIYGNAFAYENEIHDLFGIKVEGISIDFKGNFYRTAIKTPFNIPASAAPAAAATGEGEAKK